MKINKKIYIHTLLFTLGIGLTVLGGHTLAFDDTQSHWANDYIEALKAKNIVSGRSATTFAPEEQVTRAEFMKMLVIGLFKEQEDKATQVFEDVNPNSWYAKYVEFAKNHDLANGYEEGRFFRPNQSISRAEAVKIMMSALGFAQLSAVPSSFDDVVEGWQIPFIEKAKELEIIGGYTENLFGPNDFLTRAQAAKLIYNIIQFVEVHAVVDEEKGEIIIIPEAQVTFNDGYKLRGVFDKGEVLLNWNVSADSQQKILLMRSIKNPLPTHPVEDSDFMRILSEETASYIDKDITTQAGTYHYRLCSFFQGYCLNYSEVLTINIRGGVIPTKPTPQKPDTAVPEEILQDTKTPYGQCMALNHSEPVAQPILKQTLEGDSSQNWFGSPAVVDINHDGSKEIIAVRDSLLYVWKSDGTLLWKTAWGYNASNSPLSRAGRIYASPAIADLDGMEDDNREIVIGSEFGTVSAYNSKGKLLSGWPATTNNSKAGEIRSVSIANLDSDALPEVITAQSGTRPMIHVWGPGGNVQSGWPQCNTVQCLEGDALHQNIAIANFEEVEKLDYLDIVTSFDSEHMGVWNGGGAQRNSAPIFGTKSRTSQVFQYHNYSFAQNGQADSSQSRSTFGTSAPVIADIDLDGKKEIIIVGDHKTGVEDTVQGNALFVLRPDMSRSVTWETPFETMHDQQILHYQDPGNGILRTRPTPAVGDIIGDAMKEIIFPAYDGYMYAVNSQKEQVWKFDFAHGKELFASEPLIADLNRDGKPEIIFSTYGTVSGAGYLYILNNEGKQLVKQGLSTRGSMATPTIENLDNDPELELIISLKDGISSHQSGVQIFDVPGSAENCVLWKTGRGNYERTGSME